MLVSYLFDRSDSKYTLVEVYYASFPPAPREPLFCHGTGYVHRGL